MRDDRLSSPLNTYKEEIAAFDSLTDSLIAFSSRGIRHGLERVSRLLSLLGSPERTFRAIHVLGTNGKGSTAATLESIYVEAGLKTALYTSPHLVSLQERLRVNGEHISIDKWCSAFRQIKDVVCTDPVLSETKPTFFESLTAMAFLMISEAKPDIAIIEAGMGGRYDATSVCDASAVIITTISMDHTEYLGETLEAIASEKFAAVRTGIPAFYSGDNPLLVVQFLEKCESVGAIPYLLSEMGKPCEIKCSLEGTIFSYTPTVASSGRTFKKLHSPLRGIHQAYNQSNVISFLLSMPQMAMIGEAEIRRGIERTCWSGRMELLKSKDLSHTVILDGAHNEQGVGALVTALSCLIADGAICRVAGIVFAVMKDKAVSEMLNRLKTLDCPICLTQLPEERSMSSDELGRLACTLDLQVAGVFEDPKDAFNAACIAAKPDEVVLCCGSLHLVGFLKRIFAEND